MRWVILALLLMMPSSASACLHTCQESEDGTQLIRSFEGYFPFVYKDVAGYPTIGFGHLIVAGERFNEPMMGPAAEELLRKDLTPAVSAINRYVVVDLLQHQFDALGSFTFNLGTMTLQNSSLLRLVNSQQCADAKQRFLVYDKARVSGQLVVIKGLHRRRVAESDFWVCK